MHLFNGVSFSVIFVVFFLHAFVIDRFRVFIVNHYHFLLSCFYFAPVPDTDKVWRYKTIEHHINFISKNQIRYQAFFSFRGHLESDQDLGFDILVPDEKRPFE